MVRHSTAIKEIPCQKKACLNMIAAAAVVALGGCAGAVMQMPSLDEQAINDAQYDIQGRIIPFSRNISGDEVVAAVNRVTDRVRPAAYEMCRELLRTWGDERCQAIGFRRPTVVEDMDINAFADAEHNVFLLRGLVAAAGTDDEIAAVLAHEYSHVIFDHVEKNTQNVGVGALFGAIAGLAATAIAARHGVDGRDYGKIGMDLGAGAGLSFSPEMELEADHVAAFILQRAGYDLKAGNDFFVRVVRRQHNLTKGGSGSVLGFMLTHPADDKRIAHWSATIAAIKQGQRRPITQHEASVARVAQECRVLIAEYPKCDWWDGEYDWAWLWECPLAGGFGCSR